MIFVGDEVFWGGDFWWYWFGMFDIWIGILE